MVQWFFWFRRTYQRQESKSTICEDSNQDSVSDKKKNFDEGDLFEGILDDENIVLENHILVKFANKETIKYYVGVVQEVT